MVHSSENKADFTSSVFKPNGAGFSHPWSADVDSLFGAQVNADFTRQISAVVQVIAQQRYDNSYAPAVEWANVKYQFTPDISIRAGRVVLPVFRLPTIARWAMPIHGCGRRSRFMAWCRSPITTESMAATAWTSVNPTHSVQFTYGKYLDTS